MKKVVDILFSCEKKEKFHDLRQTKQKQND